MAKIPSYILSQYLWYNKSVQVDKASIYFLTFSEKSISYVLQLFSDNSSIKKWHEFKREYSLHESSCLKWLQLVDSIPERWKFIIKENYENATNLIIHDHHLIKGSRVITLDKLTPTEIYSILISKVQNKPFFNIYFENLFNGYNIDWTAIYMLPCLLTYNTYMRSFQYKILNNVLFLNKKLHTFGIKPSPLCSFFNLYDEIPLHIFYECDTVKCLWTNLVQYFQNNLILPTFPPQAAILSNLKTASNDSTFKNNKAFINHILLIFKLYVFKSREKKFINLNDLIAEIRKVISIEKEIALTNPMKKIAFTKKWLIINNIIP